MDMTKLITKKNVIAAVVTILLGAIGSGIWAYFLDPLVKSSSTIILGIITFGIKGLENQIYEDVSHGFHESASLEVFNLMFGALFAFLLYGAFIGPNSLNAKVPSARFIFFLKLCLLFFAILIIFNNLRANYVNEEITRFQNMYDITAPAMSEQDRLILKSEFARIKSHEDYDMVINQILEIAKKHDEICRNASLSSQGSS